MPGLIDQLAAETESRRQREAAVAAREEVAYQADKADRDRKARAEARRVAMKATQQMTGLVVFPARWDVDDTEAIGLRCTEVIEGKVRIDVVVNSSGFQVPVRAIIVSNVKTGEARTWKGPTRLDLPVARQPISPGRDWFRRMLVETGVI